MAPVDVQTPQAPSASAPALEPHGQSIRKPQRYEQAEYRKSHKTRMMDEPRTRRMPPPSTSRT
uniref:Uncharacterized protein n=1 Tax=Romanomermis culicivorax TaxID=13658 RepID=A0A915IVN4_ROMCU